MALGQTLIQSPELTKQTLQFISVILKLCSDALPLGSLNYFSVCCQEVKNSK